MSTSENENYSEILHYIRESKFALLTYLRSDLTPVSRAMGSFAPDGEHLFFSTGRDSAKVREIERNKRVSFYFEHDNQAPERWKSVLLIGDAEEVGSGSPHYATALERLGAKSPRFRERILNRDLESAIIYRLKTSEVEYLDRSRGYGPAVKIIVKND